MSSPRSSSRKRKPAQTPVVHPADDLSLSPGLEKRTRVSKRAKDPVLSFSDVDAPSSSGDNASQQVLDRRDIESMDEVHLSNPSDVDSQRPPMFAAPGGESSSSMMGGPRAKKPKLKTESRVRRVVAGQQAPAYISSLIDGDVKLPNARWRLLRDDQLAFWLKVVESGLDRVRPSVGAVSRRQLREVETHLASVYKAVHEELARTLVPSLPGVVGGDFAHISEQTESMRKCLALLRPQQRAIEAEIGRLNKDIKRLKKEHEEVTEDREIVEEQIRVLGEEWDDESLSLLGVYASTSHFLSAAKQRKLQKRLSREMADSGVFANDRDFKVAFKRMAKVAPRVLAPEVPRAMHSVERAAMVARTTYDEV